MSHQVVWLRQDLRISDNTALAAACANAGDAVTAIYCITPAQWQRHDVAAVRIDFELRHLALLESDLGRLNIPLVLLYADDFAALPECLAHWLSERDVSTLHANRQYEVNEIARDQAVSARLDTLAINTCWHDDQCIIAPGRVLTAEARVYTVFTPFKRNWLQQLADYPIRLLPAPQPRQQRLAQSSPVPSHVEGFVSPVADALSLHLWPAGEAAAQERLQAFAELDGEHYDSRRDLPAINGTSTLSPYLAAGIISARQCLVAARQRQAHGASSERGLGVWISELCWRDFYKHIVAGFPHVCRHHAYKRETDALPWRHDEDLFQAWCEGRTGVPIVDAAMRQLLQTGWMHNRLRMITAMFLSKDLFIDWRWGERHFMRHLIDGDFSANNGGWQWSASTGTDAVPYFRIFNPFLQSQRFDASGDFIRRFVPELAALDNKTIHQPYAKEGRSQPVRGLGMFAVDEADLSGGYPRPIIDHHEARDHAIAQFKALALSTQAQASVAIKR